jgi:hypothetical protein
MREFRSGKPIQLRESRKKEELKEFILFLWEYIIMNVMAEKNLW